MVAASAASATSATSVLPAIHHAAAATVDKALADTVFDVAIVGYGPTGAVAAALLAQAGLSVLVCERQPGVYELPRAIALDHEIMRVMQQIGIADAIAPHTEPFTPSEYFGVDGQLIRRMTMVAPPYPQGWTPSLVFTQPAVERILRAHLDRLPQVQLALGRELQRLEQDADGVTLVLDDGRVCARARWAIGCDGGSSTVRTGLAEFGMALDDLDFDEPWLVVDVKVNPRGLAKLPATSVQYCEPQRPCTLVIGPGNHRRWEIALQPGEDAAAAATPAGTWALLARWLTPQDGELWRQASYRFHALVARQWRVGRVFVAGDAAHMQPPFLGQGMCQGIRDAANLAWKLAAVVHGRAPARLLDSYGLERAAHVRELTHRIKAVGAVVSERDLAKARARDARLLAECGGVVKDTPRQDLMPPLTCGLISASPGAGLLFPQPRLAGGSLMDDHFGCGWRLVHDGLTGAGEVAQRGDLNNIDLSQVPEADAVVAQWLQRHQARAAIVRPDHYVYGTASDAAALAALAAVLSADLSAVLSAA